MTNPKHFVVWFDEPVYFTVQAENAAQALDKVKNTYSVKVISNGKEPVKVNVEEIVDINN